MKKFALFAGFMGVLFVVAGAFATDTITTASTNRVRKSVYNITYGDSTTTLSTSGTDNDYGYRRGTVPQTAKLNSIEGTSVANVTGMGANDTDWRDADLTATVSGVPYAAISNISVGSLAVDIDTTSADSIKGDSTIKNNKANVAVLKRDKLSIANSDSSVSNCGSGDECGYVTTGDHANVPATSSNTGGKVWMKIATCTTTGSGANAVTTCTGD